jgi:hypothetical protein
VVRDFLATHLLIPSLPIFGQQYPEINVEIVTGYESLDIDRREADIALRITLKPPPHLVGKRLAAVPFAPFVSRDYLRHHDLQSGTSCWIGYQRNASETPPDWVLNSAYPHLPVRGVFESLLAQLSAARAGLGIGMLPCLLGDPDTLLVRLEPGKQPPNLELWLLIYRDVRTTARLRTLMQFIAGVVGHNKALLEGREGRCGREDVSLGPVVLLGAAVGHDHDHRHELFVGIEVVEDNVGRTFLLPAGFVIAAPVQQVKHRIFVRLWHSRGACK